MCQQPTTDSCSFFTSAYILVNGEVVYFGDTGTKAVNLLMGAGMPCPPLYSPVEQYMRLVDPSFEVSTMRSWMALCIQRTQLWPFRFSEVVFRVLMHQISSGGVACRKDKIEA